MSKKEGPQHTIRVVSLLIYFVHLNISLHVVQEKHFMNTINGQDLSTFQFIVQLTPTILFFFKCLPGSMTGSCPQVGRLSPSSYIYIYMASSLHLNPYISYLSTYCFLGIYQLFNSAKF